LNVELAPTFLISVGFYSLVTMKLSVRFATFTLLLAAAAAVEASPLHDAAVLKRHSVHAHSCDPAYPGKHRHSAHVALQGASSVKLAQSLYQNPPSNHLAPAPGGSGTIKLANAGGCHPVGATGTTTRRVFIGRLEILTIVVVCSGDHDAQWS
jgi:hypothetical protein